jgi:hypothetical protein
VLDRVRHRLRAAQVTTAGFGLAALLAAVGCAVGFVAATVRADRRAHAVDPFSTSGFAGAAAVWAGAAVVCAVGALLLLGAGTARGWAP